MEKLKLYGKTADVEDKFKGYEVDPKLMMILSEDVARSYKKEERIKELEKHCAELRWDIYDYTGSCGFYIKPYEISTEFFTDFD